MIKLNLSDSIPYRRSTTMSPETYLLYLIVVSQCYFLFFFYFLISAFVSNVAGLSHLFPICLNRNGINVVVVNKPVFVDFPSIVMSRFTRTIRVPFFEFFSKSNTKHITGWPISWKSSNDSLTTEGIPISMWRKPAFCTS